MKVLGLKAGSGTLFIDLREVVDAANKELLSLSRWEKCLDFGVAAFIFGETLGSPYLSIFKIVYSDPMMLIFGFLETSNVLLSGDK